MRYRLRTLMILLALTPPALACGWSEFGKYRERERERELDKLLWSLPPEGGYIINEPCSDRCFD